MNSVARCIAAVVTVISPLVASAGVIARTAEGSEDASAAWHLLGMVGPAALWGLPLAYVVFTVVRVLPRHPKVQRELEPPRDGTLVDRLSLFADSREGW